MEIDDRELLDRAISLDRVLVSQDSDFLVEATSRRRAEIPFGGIVVAHQLRVSVAGCIADLELLARVGEPDDFKKRVVYLPL